MPRNNQQGAGKNPQGESKAPVASFGPYPTGSGLIEVSVWENVVTLEQGERLVYGVSFNRSYRDGDSWKQSKSLRAGDIPVLCHALSKAFDYIMEHQERGA